MTATFSIEAESILGTLAELFAAEGNAREVAIIANAEAEFVYSDYDNWNGGMYGFNFNLQVPIPLLTAISQDIEVCKSNILDKVNAVTEHLPDEYVKNVNITPLINSDTDWRDKARAWLSGSGISNQGRVRSDNIAARSCDGLLFRSQAEINLYKALKAAGIPFAPLPVFVKGGANYKRIEPDFIIVTDGIIMMLEVDGDTVHQETPAEAHDRATLLAHEGVHIERVKASECATLEEAKECARKIQNIIAKVKMRR